MNTLVIDDDPVSRMALVDLLHRFELGACGEFASGTAAWQYMEVNPPPILICCDVRMPGLSGIEFLRKLKASPDFARIPFVLVTSATERDVVQEAVLLGANGYIVKPFAMDEARAKLQGIIRASWNEIAEDPAATLRRLSLPAPKLNVYYSAFRRQIDDALGILVGNPSTGQSQVLERLDALQTGCLTLGLWHGARILQSLKVHPTPQTSIKDYLMAVGEALDLQRQGIRDGSWRSGPPS